MITNEQVRFRLYVCPSCGHNLCWVNPRPPSYCPECGTLHLHQAWRASALVVDDEAWLRVNAGVSTLEAARGDI